MIVQQTLHRQPSPTVLCNGGGKTRLIVNQISHSLNKTLNKSNMPWSSGSASGLAGFRYFTGRRHYVFAIDSTSEFPRNAEPAKYFLWNRYNTDSKSDRALVQCITGNHSRFQELAPSLKFNDTSVFRWAFRSSKSFSTTRGESGTTRRCQITA